MSVIEDYVEEKSWRNKANANHNKSFSGLQSMISGTELAKDAIQKFGKYGKRHLDGAYHLHNLEGGVYAPYCNGNDLLSLLQRGLYNPVGVSSKPAKHFSTVLDHIVNFTYIMTGEFMGAQAWRSLDVLLAPFIHFDKLNQEQVEQEMQQMIWGFAYPMRPSFQTPFVNITFDLRPSEFHKDMPITIGGETKIKYTYSDFQDEIDMLNKAFLNIMIKSPDGKQPFTFPMPTYNITKDFKWDNEISDLIFELAASWGSCYFANLTNTNLKESDALSMCCRLRLDLNEVHRASGGIWNFGNNTGALAVHTINLPRIGYLSNGNEKKYFRILDEMLSDGKEYLLRKKEYIRQGVDKGLFPMSEAFIGDKLFNTYFLTIGINGLNESSINFCGKNILENVDWCERVLQYCRDKTIEFQKTSGHLFNFEATPAEGSSYSLARIDREKFPSIFTQGDEKEPYYTGSSLIPASYDMSLPDVLEHQNRLQKYYTGGSVLHIDQGELWGASAVKDLIRAVCKNTELPYITWSPSYHVCPTHGKSGGKACCEKSVVYSRPVGYIRPVTNFNIGKAREFKDKKFFRT